MRSFTFQKENAYCNAVIVCSKSLPKKQPCVSKKEKATSWRKPPLKPNKEASNHNWFNCNRKKPRRQSKFQWVLNSETEVIRRHRRIATQVPNPTRQYRNSQSPYTASGLDQQKKVSSADQSRTGQTITKHHTRLQQYHYHRYRC